MRSPLAARNFVRIARKGTTLHADEWNLIEDYLSELISYGVLEPAEVASRLERRGQTAEVDCVTGVPIAFPRGGRRQHDSKT